MWEAGGSRTETDGEEGKGVWRETLRRITWRSRHWSEGEKTGGRRVGSGTLPVDSGILLFPVLPYQQMTAPSFQLLRTKPWVFLIFFIHTHTHTPTNLQTAWSCIKYHHQLPAHPYSQAALSSSLVHQEGNSTSASGPLHDLICLFIVCLPYENVHKRRHLYNLFVCIV